MLSADNGWALALCRGVADLALLGQFGAMLAFAWLARPVLASLPRNAAVALVRRLTTLAGLSVAAAMLATAAWLALQSLAIAGSLDDAAVVLLQTEFGHFVLARLGLLLLAGSALAWGRPAMATVFSGAALVTQAGLGHAWAMVDGPSLLLLSVVVHLLAAGAWLGGLAPLLLLLSAAAPPVAAGTARRFAGFGTACVIALVGTAAVQGGALVGSVSGLVATGYGLVALAKLGLFVVLLAFAARNRFRLAPALEGDAPAPAKRRLLRSIGLETGVGVLIVLAAGLLGSLAPAMEAASL